MSQEEQKYVWEEGEERPVAEPTSSTMCEIVGHESLRGKRLPLGVLLSLSDLVAARTAYLFCQSSMATVAFDSVVVRSPPRHGEMVRFTAHLVGVGTSSMRVLVEAHRHLGRKRYVDLIQLFVTMVAITPTGRPNRRIPQLPESFSPPAGSERPPPLQLEDAASAHDEAVSTEEREEFVPVADTELTLRRIFLPRHVNINQTVFGGDLLLWMDRHASYTASSFSGSDRVVTLALSEVAFHLPVTTRDFVEMQARVVYVRGNDMVVSIGVSVERGEKGSGGNVLTSHSSHSAHFVCRVYDEIGLRVGLALPDVDSPHYKEYVRGRALYESLLAMGAPKENAVIGLRASMS